MKRILSLLIFSCLGLNLIAQKKAEDFGYQHHQILFEQDTVDILIKSKKGEEHLKKPIFFEVQGSLPYPLIVHNGERMVRYVMLSEGFVEKDYHLVLVNKPGIPLLANKDELSKNGYRDPATQRPPKAYQERNHLDYYVRRNQAVMDYIKKQTWVDTSKIVLAGHSEGSTIVTYMAEKISGVTHLIYSGGLPYFSRILAMLQQERLMEQNEENPWVQKTLEYWKDVNAHPNALDRNEGWNTNKGTFSFSQSENEVLRGLQIPILICYGTKEESAPFNDMFHIETIKNGHTNFTFKAYVGADHYYQRRKADNSREDLLNTVVGDWLAWLSEK